MEATEDSLSCTIYVYGQYDNLSLIVLGFVRGSTECIIIDCQMRFRPKAHLYRQNGMETVI
jgi:hypothetical protein